MLHQVITTIVMCVEHAQVLHLNVMRLLKSSKKYQILLFPIAFAQEQLLELKTALVQNFLVWLQFVSPLGSFPFSLLAVNV